MAAPINPAGSNYKQEKVFRLALQRAVNRISDKEGKDGLKRIEVIAEAVAKAAEIPEPWAVKEVGDRLPDHTENHAVVTT